MRWIPSCPAYDAYDASDAFDAYDAFDAFIKVVAIFDVRLFFLNIQEKRDKKCNYSWTHHSEVERSWIPWKLKFNYFHERKITDIFFHAELVKFTVFNFATTLGAIGYYALVWGSKKPWIFEYSGKKSAGFWSFQRIEWNVCPNRSLDFEIRCITKIQWKWSKCSVFGFHRTDLKEVKYSNIENRNHSILDHSYNYNTIQILYRLLPYFLFWAPTHSWRRPSRYISISLCNRLRYYRTRHWTNHRQFWGVFLKARSANFTVQVTSSKTGLRSFCNLVNRDWYNSQ